MSSRFVLPLETPVDATGSPYPGGKLFFYQSGTSTKLNTYTSPDLDPSHANTNPVVLDSAGRFPNAIFLQNRAYKVVLSPSTDSDPPTAPIWTQDPVYTPDYSTAAQFTSGSGSPNGAVAGTAGSATILASSYWDFANQILYICTTTGSTSTAVWTAVNATTAAAVVPAPQGRLTLMSGTPVLDQDVTAATAVYYTPYTGLLVPIYNGVTFIPTSIVSELQATLTSSHAANNIYDFYVFSLNGVVTLGTGPTWSAGTAGSITAGSCARGTGAGGAAISRVQGVWTNAASMTIRYGNGTLTTTVNANQATYIGTMAMDGTNGQVSCYVSYGQSRKWGIWNAYNRVPIIMQMGDSTATWTAASTSFGPSNANANNVITTLEGLPEEFANISFVQGVTCNSNNSTSAGQIGIGKNSTTIATGKIGTQQLTTGNTGTVTTSVSDIIAQYTNAPGIGINNFTALNRFLSTNATFGGTIGSMLVEAQYNG